MFKTLVQALNKCHQFKYVSNSYKQCYNYILLIIMQLQKIRFSVILLLISCNKVCYDESFVE